MRVDRSDCRSISVSTAMQKICMYEPAYTGHMYKYIYIYIYMYEGNKLVGRDLQERSKNGHIYTYIYIYINIYIYIFIQRRCAQIRHRAIFKAKSGVILNEMVDFSCFYRIFRFPGGPVGALGGPLERPEAQGRSGVSERGSRGSGGSSRGSRG